MFIGILRSIASYGKAVRHLRENPHACPRHPTRGGDDRNACRSGPGLSLPIAFRMTERPPPLRPATQEDVAEALAFALRFDGRKRTHDADLVMARITADRLVRHLEQSGFVLMKRPPAALPSV
jgi:hypothetical protein